MQQPGLYLVPSEARMRRARLGLSQVVVARSIGTSSTRYSLWERGEAAVAPRYVDALVAALGGGRRGLFRRAVRATGAPQ